MLWVGIAGLFTRYESQHAEQRYEGEATHILYKIKIEATA